MLAHLAVSLLVGFLVFVSEVHAEDAAFRKKAEETYLKLTPCLQSAWIYAKNGHNVTFKVPTDLHDHHQAVKSKLDRFKHTAHMHTYRHYSGPWIENHFINHFESQPVENFNGVVPLFVPWVDNQRNGEKIWNEIMQALKSVLRSDVIYLAVSQGDIGLAKIGETFPNILVLSGGGFGHIPVPLIKGEIPYHPLHLPAQWDQEIGFFGNMQQASRPVMFAEIRRIADELKISHKIAFGPTWIEMMAKSKYNLAPRGFGRSSFRFAEAMHIGRVPIFLYDDVPWIPYLTSPRLDINLYGFAAGLNATREEDRIPALLKKLKATTEEEYMQKHRKVQEIREHFTYGGVMKQIAQLLQDPFGEHGGDLRCTPRHPSQEHEIL